jgi:hypothetical protein
MFRFSFAHIPQEEDKKGDFPLVTALDFGKLHETPVIEAAPLQCASCGSVISDTSLLKTTNKGYTFECPFCLAHNAITKEIGDEILGKITPVAGSPAMSAADLCFILDQIKKEKTKENKAESKEKDKIPFPITVAAIDVSGSMGGGKLEAVKTALVQNIHKITADYPTMTFVLAPFSTNVELMLTPDNRHYFKDGPNFHKEEKLIEELRPLVQKSPFKPLEKNFEKWTAIVKNMGPMDMTALGPALFLGLQTIIQSQSDKIPKPGGRVLLLTDGLANIGMGSIENSASAKDSGPSVFYHHLAELAVQNNIIVDIVAVRDASGGNSVALDIIGSITDYTGGSMAFVKAEEIESTFDQFRGTNFVARNVTLRVFAPEFLHVDEIEGVNAIGGIPDKNGEPIQLGAFSAEQEIFIKFKRVKAPPKTVTKYPVQIQLQYMDAEGHKRVRIFRQEVDVATDEDAFKKDFKADVASAYELAKAANLRRKGDLEMAKQQASQTMARNQMMSQGYGFASQDFDDLVKDELKNWEAEEKQAEEESIADKKSFYASKGQSSWRASSNVKMERMKKKK